MEIVKEPGGMCEVVVVVVVVVIVIVDFYTLGYVRVLLFRKATVAKCKVDRMFHETMRLSLSYWLHKAYI
jgi:hypothetical protein